MTPILDQEDVPKQEASEEAQEADVPKTSTPVNGEAEQGEQPFYLSAVIGDTSILSLSVTLDPLAYWKFLLLQRKELEKVFHRIGMAPPSPWC